VSKKPSERFLELHPMRPTDIPYGEKLYLQLLDELHERIAKLEDGAPPPDELDPTKTKSPEPSVCGECGAYAVEALGSSVTSAYYAPYFDTDGRRHHHDANVIRSALRCANGHTIVLPEKIAGSCWCGWPANAKEAEPAPIGVYVGDNLGKVKGYEPEAEGSEEL